MDRREAISKVGILFGGSVIGSSVFLGMGFKFRSEQINDLFNQDQVSLLNEIAETIIPARDTPGAKAAKVGHFMALMVKDCYGPKDQNIFIDGIGKLNLACQQKFGNVFLDCDAKQRTEILTSLDAEQKAYMSKKKAEDPNHYFRMMKELTLLGFFTSEIGATKVLKYTPVPGRYNGCVPQKAW
jgi:hypothetical protein